MGQPVNQVEVDRSESRLPNPPDDFRGEIPRLDSMDRLLDLGIEVLHTEAGAIEPKLGIQCDIVMRDVPRVQLDGEVAIDRLAEVEMTLQAFDHRGQVVDIQAAGGNVRRYQGLHLAGLHRFLELGLHRDIDDGLRAGILRFEGLAGLPLVSEILAEVSDAVAMEEAALAIAVDEAAAPVAGTGDVVASAA